MGLFDGLTPKRCGPLGTLLVYLIMGICAVCITECLAETLGSGPIGTSMIEFVGTLLDRDLAVVVGVAYWYLFPLSSP